MKDLWRIFGKPVLFIIVSTVGLLLALIGDGILDVVAWVALAIPLIPAIAGLIGWGTARRTVRVTRWTNPGALDDAGRTTASRQRGLHVTLNRNDG